MKPPNVNCKFCKKGKYVKPYLLKTFKYCSRSCLALDKRVHIKADCAICGKKFEHVSSRCNKAKYCSRRCYHKSQIGKGGAIFKCYHCGIEFRDSLCRDRKYCSSKCVGKANREIWKAKFTTVRRKMIKENKVKICEICGYNKVFEILGIHHKDGNRENNEKENLQVLCPMCHSLIHKKHITH